MSPTSKGGGVAGPFQQFVLGKHRWRVQQVGITCAIVPPEVLRSWDLGWWTHPMPHVNPSCDKQLLTKTTGPVRHAPLHQCHYHQNWLSGPFSEHLMRDGVHLTPKCTAWLVPCYNLLGIPPPPTIAPLTTESQDVKETPHRTAIITNKNFSSSLANCCNSPCELLQLIHKKYHGGPIANTWVLLYGVLIICVFYGQKRPL